MNIHLVGLDLYLSTLVPSPAGWLTIDRDRAAANLGLSRVKLARILSKAEKALGIVVEGDQVRPKTERELNLERHGLTPGWKDRMMETVADVMRSYDQEKSQAPKY